MDSSHQERHSQLHLHMPSQSASSSRYINTPGPVVCHWSQHIHQTTSHQPQSILHQQRHHLLHRHHQVWQCPSSGQLQHQTLASSSSIHLPRHHQDWHHHLVLGHHHQYIIDQQIDQQPQHNISQQENNTTDHEYIILRHHLQMYQL